MLLQGFDRGIVGVDGRHHGILGHCKAHGTTLRLSLTQFAAHHTEVYHASNGIGHTFARTAGRNVDLHAWM